MIDDKEFIPCTNVKILILDFKINIQVKISKLACNKSRGQQTLSIME